VTDKHGGGIHSLSLSEVAVDQPKPWEVLLKIHAVSVQVELSSESVEAPSHMFTSNLF
jgi:hypothetical protein